MTQTETHITLLKQETRYGWNVSTWNDWLTLIFYLGGGTVGGKLKETGTLHWFSPNTGATNETGFTALPGGKRSAHIQGRSRNPSGYGLLINP